jgi:hypothetical protein
VEVGIGIFQVFDFMEGVWLFLFIRKDSRMCNLDVLFLKLLEEISGTSS